MMLPGRATERVDVRGPEGVKTAVGFDVSVSLALVLPFVVGCWSVRLRFWQLY